MDVKEKVDALVESGFISNKPLIGNLTEGGVISKSVAIIKSIIQGNEMGFSALENAEYVEREKTIRVGVPIGTKHTKKLFLSYGLKTPADDFILYHEISHKRMHENSPEWTSQDGEFSMLLQVLRKGPDERMKGNEDLLELMQYRFVESYADMMAIHLSSREFADSPQKLTHFIAEMRYAKKDDPRHDGSFGLEAASRAFADKGVSNRFVSDRNFAEGLALRVAKMNCFALLKDDSVNVRREGSYGVWLTEMKNSIQSGGSVFSPVILENVSKQIKVQPELMDVGERVGNRRPVESGYPSRKPD